MSVLTWVAALWLATLLAGIVSWEKAKKGRIRRSDVVVVALSAILGGAWFLILLPRSSTAPPAPVEVTRTRTATCAVIVPGDAADSVKTRLGAPDETRSEAETRGPASEVWIYRDSRCAIHMLSGAVESIE